MIRNMCKCVCAPSNAVCRVMKKHVNAGEPDAGHEVSALIVLVSRL
jgi:hypothetical protein